MNIIYLILQLVAVLAYAAMGFIVWRNVYYENIQPYLPSSHKRHCRNALRDMASDLRKHGL